MGLTEISLSLVTLGSPSGMEHHLGLLSTIFSPRLQRITLTLNATCFVRRDKFGAMMLGHKQWESVEEVFLQLAAIIASK